MPNRVGESLGSSLIFWRIILRRVQPRSWRKLDDRLGRLRSGGASVPFRTGASSRRARAVRRGVDRLAVVVGELDGHHDRVVLEDLAELAELHLFVEAGQVPGHRGAGWLRVAPAWRGRTRKISPPRASVVDHDAHASRAT